MSHNLRVGPTIPHLEPSSPGTLATAQWELIWECGQVVTGVQPLISGPFGTPESSAQLLNPPFVIITQCPLPDGVSSRTKLPQLQCPVPVPSIRKRLLRSHQSILQKRLAASNLSFILLYR